MANFAAARYRGLRPSPMMRMAALAAGVEGCIDLTLGEPDVPTPRDICSKLAEAAYAGETHYAAGMGLPGLREAVAAYWNGRYGLGFRPDEVLVTTGGSQACFLTMQACLDPGDEVLILEPFFTFYEAHVKQAGGVPVFCMSGADDDFLPDPDAIEKKITPRTKALIVNSPCNPTGAVLSRGILEGLARLAAKYDLLVVSDELYEAFVYEGEHIPFASLPGMKERTVTIGGMSKSYAMTGWRLGYAMGDQELLRTMQVIGVVQTVCPSTMVQRASEYALRSCDGEIKEITELFRRRVACACEAFSALPGIKTVRPRGSFYLFIDVSGTGLSGEEFAVKMLEEARVVTIPGVSFGPDCGGYVRIACTVSEEKLREAAERIGKVLGKK